MNTINKILNIVNIKSGRFYRDIDDYFFSKQYEPQETINILGELYHNIGYAHNDILYYRNLIDNLLESFNIMTNIIDTYKYKYTDILLQLNMYQQLNEFGIQLSPTEVFKFKKILESL